MAPEVDVRDLLVSAQTGSGKTVAFGLALAKTLLGDAERFTAAGAPRALIVTPTRELAMQVHRELSWLYAETGARITTCVGGMDPRREGHALSMGVHIVVGTPGRLCDHLARGALKLDRLAAVVLDEADEMLDMGFREDLERLLDAAPKDRRTLLFSATIPKQIATLAKQYQRDAMRVATSGEGDRHRDIAYQVVTVVPRERDLAVVNLLRYYDPPGALVFCGTRDGVTHLAANLSERGFSVAALSGELSQRERNQALQALRDGRARVCVATDVAARGLDLPDLGLVIHADLPQNKEALVHRSGRTGRAGKKGLAIILAVDAARRFVERLLQSARVDANWLLAPSSDDIRKRDQEHLAGEVEKLTEEISDADREVARALLADRSAEDLVAALVRVRREARPAPEELTVPMSMRPRSPADRRAPGGPGGPGGRDVPRSRYDHAVRVPQRDDRAQRFGNDRFDRNDQRNDQRSDQPRAERPSWGAPSGPRAASPARDGDARPARPERPQRADRNDAPMRSDAGPRGDGPARSDAAPRSDGPARSDAAPRSDGPARVDAAPRGDGPARVDAAPSSERNDGAQSEPRDAVPSSAARASEPVGAPASEQAPWPALAMAHPAPAARDDGALVGSHDRPVTVAPIAAAPPGARAVGATHDEAPPAADKLPARRAAPAKHDESPVEARGGASAGGDSELVDLLGGPPPIERAVAARPAPLPAARTSGEPAPRTDRAPDEDAGELADLSPGERPAAIAAKPREPKLPRGERAPRPEPRNEAAAVTDRADDTADDDAADVDDAAPAHEAAPRPARAERPTTAARAGKADSHARRVRAVPADRAEYSRPERSVPAGGDDARKLVWFTINIGRSKNADPKWLIPLLCRRGGISKNAIGKIQILARETRVEISHDVSERFAAAVREPDTKDRNIHIEPLDSLAV